MKNVMKNVMNKLNKTDCPTPTLEELAVAVTNEVYNNIMSLDKYTVETLMVIHEVARELNSDYVTYKELVERIPYVLKGDYPVWHLMNLKENCNLIWTEDYVEEDESEEMIIYIRGIDYSK